MTAHGETWYLRLPDGRTLRAPTLEALRAHLRAGRAPWDSRARRSGEDAWQPLGAHPQLADLVPRPSPSPPSGNGTARHREPTPEVRTVGVRGLVDELLGALDSSLQRVKWACAGATCLLLAVGGLVMESLPVAAQVTVATAMLFTLSLCTYVLTRMTAVELSQLRRARAADVRDGLVGQTLRIFIAQALVGALIVGAVILLRSVPDWLTELDAGEGSAWLDVARPALAVARVVLGVMCWPLLAFAVLLLGPILVVEETSVLGAFREWVRLLRDHLGRVYLYESLAFALAAAVALPLLSVVALTAYSLGDAPSLAEAITLRLLAAATLTPPLAYLLVANVFIYLNLRYEFSSVRER